jgi:hypothetical protein
MPARALTLLAVAWLAVGACPDDDSVQAINLATGETTSFASAEDIPAGWQECVGGSCPDPYPCAAVAEIDCLARTDCEPVYTPCDAGTPVFAACTEAVTACAAATESCATTACCDGLACCGAGPSTTTAYCTAGACPAVTASTPPRPTNTAPTR